jgi:hypothetical protein
MPSGVVVRAWASERCAAATGGSGLTVETGSESAIDISLREQGEKHGLLGDAAAKSKARREPI